MQIGPTYIYKCPECDKLCGRGSLLSGNTFGSTYFSDGKVISPMLPDYPDIVKCKKCKTFFWLEDKNHIDYCDGFADFDGFHVQFLDTDEYFEALNAGIARNKKEELYLRKYLWWSFNDRTRNGKDLFLTESEKEIYEANCVKLMALFGNKEQTLVAELYRNLGNFTECIDTLESIKSKNIIWLKNILKNECFKENTLVIELNDEDD